MIIQNNKLEPNDIIALKLVSGEEVMARVVDINEKSVTITKPAMMTIVQAPGMSEGQGGVVFIPWTLGLNTDSKINICVDKIIAYGPALKEAADGYTRATSSIAVPTEGLDLTGF